MLENTVYNSTDTERWLDDTWDIFLLDFSLLDGLELKVISGELEFFGLILRFYNNFLCFFKFLLFSLFIGFIPSFNHRSDVFGVLFKSFTHLWFFNGNFDRFNSNWLL